MAYKILVSTIYIKNAQAVRGLEDPSIAGDYREIASLYNDSGIDKLIILDLSEDDEEHEKNVAVIGEITKLVDIPVCAGGNIERMADVKKLFFVGCKQVLLNGDKANAFDLAEDASARFGKEKINVSIKNVDFLFKHQEELKGHFHEILVLNPDILDAIDLLTDLQYVVTLPEDAPFEEIVDVLSRQNIRGVSGSVITDMSVDIMDLKTRLAHEGISMDNFAPKLKWTDLKKNSDGLVPVVVQDYQTDQVLMLAYMNEESFSKTITLGKMTYYSRSRKELWTKGMTSGHIQYVKSLVADCDYDTILAKVSQVGPACHTGEKSCFFNEIVKKEYVERNPLKVLENMYKTLENRRNGMGERTYENYLLDQGLDQILKKCGEESIEVIIAAKNPDGEALRHEMSDFIYHLMLLMIEKEISWEEITRELAQR